MKWIEGNNGVLRCGGGHKEGVSQTLHTESQGALVRPEVYSSHVHARRLGGARRGPEVWPTDGNCCSVNMEGVDQHKAWGTSKTSSSRAGCLGEQTYQHEMTSVHLDWPT